MDATPVPANQQHGQTTGTPETPDRDEHALPRTDQHREQQPGAGAANGSAHEPLPGHASDARPDSGRQEFSPEIEAEIDAAMAALDRAEAPERGQGKGPRPKGGHRSQPPATHPPHPSVPGAKPAIRGPRVVEAGREHRTGAVVSVGPTDLFLEFGPKELGVAPRIQWPDDALPKVGDQIEVVVDRFEPGESLFICSRPGAVQKAAWELLQVGQVVEARVTGVNKGGLELEVAGHRAFMPASQASLDRVEDLSVYIGEKFPCKVSQLDRRGRGNIVLSRRDVLAEERQEQAKKLRETIKEGDVLQGTVRKIMPFGAFVDIGGIDGLVHMSDLTYDRVNYGQQTVGKYIKEGQQVTVKVLKADWEHDRISLGIKQLMADPFSTATTQLADGAEVTGRVTRLTDFGAFVEITPGVEGLVHVSEIAHRRIGKPADVLKPNEVVKARVLKIDPESRKISLSIKALQPAPEVRGRDRKPVGRSQEEIMKDTPALRRLREKFGKTQFKGGLG